MGHRERILTHIQKFPGRDDDEISAALQIRPRQRINQICRKLETFGHLSRRVNAHGKIGNFPINSGTTVSVIAQKRNPLSPEILVTNNSAVDEWFWEGNVVDGLERALVKLGWETITKANTLTKERGIDLSVKRDGVYLLIEAKGYPSKYYRDPKKSGMTKPTNPTLQAQHWFSHALHKALLIKSSSPTECSVIGLPDFPRYRSLYKGVSAALNALGIGIIFIDDVGEIEVLGIQID